EEALLQANKVLDDLEKQPPTPVRQKNQHREGPAYWLKARALRERIVARTRAEGRSLCETSDPLTGEACQDLAHLTDPETRRTILSCLFQAALRLPTLEPLQREALREALQLEPTPWEDAALFARNLRALAPQDTGALYVLARCDFEQLPSPIE